MQPVPPTINIHNQKEDMEGKIGVQLLLPENNEGDQYIGNSHGPGENIFFNQVIDSQQTK